MAGSWKHFTDGSGRFIGDQLLEQPGGDVVEALEEAYGMVWFLAEQLRVAGNFGDRNEQSQANWRAEFVDAARENYKHGLQVSPGFTLRAAAQNINWDKAWGENRRAWPDEEDE